MLVIPFMSDNHSMAYLSKSTKDRVHKDLAMVHNGIFLDLSTHGKHSDTVKFCEVLRQLPQDFIERENLLDFFETYVSKSLSKVVAKHIRNLVICEGSGGAEPPPARAGWFCRFFIGCAVGVNTPTQHTHTREQDRWADVHVGSRHIGQRTAARNNSLSTWLQRPWLRSTSNQTPHDQPRTDWPNYSRIGPGL